MSVIEDNINARRDAEEVMELIGDGRHQHFWECLVEMAKAKLPRLAAKQPDAGVMNDDDARRFAAQTLWPYPGYSKDLAVRDVDPEFVAKIADGSDFEKKLRRYVRSNYFRDLQRRADDARPEYVHRKS